LASLYEGQRCRNLRPFLAYAALDLRECELDHFVLDLRPHGQAALSVVAQEDPSTFVKVAASIMPEEKELTMREVSAKDLSDDALAAIAVGAD
jgi:hypothetical protein